MKQIEEQYIHFVICMRNLNNALNIFQELRYKKDLSPIIINAAFQFAIIEYAKPYKYSKGEALHALDRRHIPSHLLALHKRILDARDQIHAHTDLTVLEAKIYVKDTFYGKNVVISQNIIHGTQELTNVDEIIELIEKTLDNMITAEKLLKNQLAQNS